MLYKKMGRYEPAVREWIRSSEIHPNPVIFEELGNLCLSRLGDARKAKDYYIQGIKAGKPGSLRVEQLRWMIQDLECR